MGTTGRGVADIAQTRGMIIPYAAGLVFLTIIFAALPAFAEPCSRPAARAGIPATDIFEVADTVIVRPDPAVVTA